METPLASPEKIKAYDKAQSAIQEKNQGSGRPHQEGNDPVSDADAGKDRRFSDGRLAVGAATQDRAENDGEGNCRGEEGVHEIFLKRWVDYTAKPAKEQLPQLAKWNELRADPDSDSAAHREEMEGKRRKAAEAFRRTSHLPQTPPGN